MRRRRIVLLLGLLPLACLAQPSPNVARVGFLAGAPLSGMTRQLEALRRGLRELGYVEKKNFVFELRSADGRYERLPSLAAELVGLGVDLIVAVGTPPTQAAKAATATIPIVMMAVGDPVSSKLVASLSRPGGNVTGTSNISPPLMVKRLELLKEMHPSLRRVAVLINPGNPAQHLSFQAMEAAGRALKIAVHKLEARSLDDIKGRLPALPAQGIEAVAVANDTIFVAHAPAIASLATEQRLLSSGSKEFAQAGGLIGYGSSEEVYRHTARYVDRILKGASPADLPVEQPSTFEVFFNQKTAKALDLKVPASFLVRADRVIE